jgi:hypothetical protein
MNQLEELFNEKLGNHAIPPPTGGWERVAVNLSKKNRTIVWIRWAAVLVVGMVAVGVIATRQSTPAELVSQKKITPPKAEDTKQKDPVATTSTPEPKVEKKIASKRSIEMKAKSETTETPVADVTVKQVAELAQAEAVTSTTEQIAVEPTKESTVASHSMVITYTLDPVVAVTPETVTADADQKASSLGKVVKFARDMKNGDSQLSLKVVKEDLFAHSKKKSPTKTH